MSNGKSNGRDKLVRTLAIIILVVGFIWLEIMSVSVRYGDEEQSNKPNSEVTQNTAQTPALDAEGELILTMIDCGQADSYLFIQDGVVALVDCGTRSTGDDVVEYLKSQGITKIDYVFGTHPHDDHMGGMYDVITNFQIGQIIIPEVEAGEVTANWYMKLIKELGKDNYDVHYAKLGEVYNLGGATMNVIGPISEPKDNINNYSIVMKVSFGEMDIIMTGDAETDVEEEILKSGVNLDAEILKVGHHGSDTSTSDEFLDAIDPDYALISAKVGNKYEHPVKSTMEKLEERDIEVYRTDELGTVVVTITTDSANFSSNPGDYLSGPELEERSTK